MLIIKSPEQFEREVLQADKPVLVDFYADWCGPCRALAPVLEELDDPAKPYYIGKVNVDEVAGLSEKYSVFSVPTILVFRDGVCVKRGTGLKNRRELEDLL